MAASTTFLKIDPGCLGIRITLKKLESQYGPLIVHDGIYPLCKPLNLKYKPERYGSQVCNSLVLCTRGYEDIESLYKIGTILELLGC